MDEKELGRKYRKLCKTFGIKPFKHAGYEEVQTHHSEAEEFASDLESLLDEYESQKAQDDE